MSRLSALLTLRKAISYKVTEFTFTFERVMYGC